MCKLKLKKPHREDMMRIRVIKKRRVKLIFEN